MRFFSLSCIGYGNGGLSISGPSVSQDGMALRLVLLVAALTSFSCEAAICTPYQVNQIKGVPCWAGLDINQDGNADLVLYRSTDGTAYPATSNGTGSFTYTYLLWSPQYDVVRYGDFDGDGKMDVLLYNSVTTVTYLGIGIGDGTFSFHALFFSLVTWLKSETSMETVRLI